MKQLIDFNDPVVVLTLKELLKDRTTKKNIIWATDTYEHLGDEYSAKRHMSEKFLYSRDASLFQPRILRSEEEQKNRTKAKGEVFTPSWICNKMNNYVDEDWFGYKNVFNEETNEGWITKEDPIAFPKGKTWKHYVDSRRLEITCGEAPFLVSRYDTSTGQIIIPTKNRIGILDRKLRVVGENAKSEDEWIKWALRSLESCYGYEYQGDSLLIARINMLLSFDEYHREIWSSDLENKVLLRAARIISWNLWQMDGLKGTIPMGSLYQPFVQMTLFNFDDEPEEQAMPCKIYDWRRDNSIRFMDLKNDMKR